MLVDPAVIALGGDTVTVLKVDVPRLGRVADGASEVAGVSVFVVCVGRAPNVVVLFVYIAPVGIVRREENGLVK